MSSHKKNGLTMICFAYFFLFFSFCGVVNVEVGAICLILTKYILLWAPTKKNRFLLLKMSSKLSDLPIFASFFLFEGWLMWRWGKKVLYSQNIFYFVLPQTRITAWNPPPLYLFLSDTTNQKMKRSLYVIFADLLPFMEDIWMNTRYQYINDKMIIDYMYLFNSIIYSASKSN